MDNKSPVRFEFVSKESGLCEIILYYSHREYSHLSWLKVVYTSNPRIHVNCFIKVTLYRTPEGNYS